LVCYDLTQLGPLLFLYRLKPKRGKPRERGCADYRDLETRRQRRAYTLRDKPRERGLKTLLTAGLDPGHSGKNPRELDSRN